VADIAIFDPATVRHTNPFENPKSYAEGVHYTVVDGVLVIDGGEHTGARPGRPLLGRGYEPFANQTHLRSINVYQAHTETSGVHVVRRSIAVSGRLAVSVEELVCRKHAT
jgi:hypothetical protein